MLIIKKLKAKAKKLMLDLVVLHLAYQNSKTPWTAKAIIVIILGYALSPIDLIPDFIPILGLLDDLILLPLGIYLAIKLIPKEVLETSRILAKTYQWERKKSVMAVLIIALIWIGIACTTINLILYNKY
ncbi:YkvA family protein [Arenibacter palladensis]|uniref:YkvA family protein n=1 Tax=Arenibacter palladensis TaxID=237373 RepID=UPI0026E45ADC|nr:DUF1232 domain-containing protein [Arenibacter palladensis]MDO6601503.1 DUF1232 domain-containing protein [Arenibacter palladensis]